VISLPVLSDAFARKVTYLRVSLTDRCNYRCTYCMPEEGVELLPKADVLSFEEIERLARVFVGLGVRRVRLTGGEPTVRKDVIACVERLAAIPGLEVVMTTNGHRLVELAPELKAAGLAGINVSVDTLDAAKFRDITRRGDLARVLAGIDAVLALGIPTKLNVVALKGFNDGEIGGLCDHGWARGAVPRFIEWMPMSGGELYAPGAILTAAEIRAAVEQHAGALVPDEPSAAAVGPARYWRTAEGRRVGVISAMSENFCATCNRVRLTAVGELHTCLAHDDATNLRAILRGGGDDAAVEDAIRAAISGKRKGHEFGMSGCGGPRKHMVSIGG
jgi:cyclic pyranopterin phosphate synthase